MIISYSNAYNYTETESFEKFLKQILRLLILLLFQLS